MQSSVWVFVVSLLVVAWLAPIFVCAGNRGVEEVRTETRDMHDLECQMRKLAVDYARLIQPWRDHEDHVFREIHEALQLTTMCGKVPPPSREDVSVLRNRKTLDEEQALLASCENKREFHCIFVSANSSDDGDGSLEHPVGCLHKALTMSRAARRQSSDDGGIKNQKPTKIILREGIHDLKYRTLVLSGEIDSNLQIMAYPNEEAWISGGIPLPKSGLQWTPWDKNNKVWVADLTQVLGEFKDKIPLVPSLFSSTPEHTRYIRARYPNDNPEIHNEHRSDVNLASDMVLEWHKADPGEVPTFDYILLEKNDSTMEGYNLYASGHGGVCSDVWGPNADSYWCSNFSSGGWAEVDQQAAVSGKIQLPVGVTWNTTTEDGQRLSRWTREEAKNAIVFAWHSQTWAMHMFRINDTGSVSVTEGNNEFYFEQGGGKQGGRNWCRCDQCTYAGGWCGQHQNPPNNSDTRLIGGLWWVENALPELDVPGEFWYNHSSNLLYVYPNTTDTDESWKSFLRLAVLENVLVLRNVSNVHVSGVGFRDSAASFMSEWSAPSGGDWSLHRGGTIFIENAIDIVIRNSTFRRLDSNAIFLSRRTRNVLIEKNTFEWLAENAVATWGDTNKFNATKGETPQNTMIYHNVMRELGIYEKQSSSFGQAKASLSDIRNNIMFNLPRAAINFNDMVGGGDQVRQNLIFNSCRESGDHGPINSWDRQPYLTKLRDGKTPSFNPVPRQVIGNFIFANYGAAQGIDNDDGSSWFHIAKNVFYWADGFKMDYGGHDSVFEDNLVLAVGSKSCIGTGSFKRGHGDVVRNNTCLVGLETISAVFDPQPKDFLQDTMRKRLTGLSRDNIATLETCKSANIVVGNNTYYTPDGNATYFCWQLQKEVSLEQMQEWGVDQGSTVQLLPSVKEIVQWARSLLMAEVTPTDEMR